MNCHRLDTLGGQVGQYVGFDAAPKHEILHLVHLFLLFREFVIYASTKRCKRGRPMKESSLRNGIGRQKYLWSINNPGRRLDA